MNALYLLMTVLLIAAISWKFFHLRSRVSLHSSLSWIYYLLITKRTKWNRCCVTLRLDQKRSCSSRLIILVDILSDCFLFSTDSLGTQPPFCEEVQAIWKNHGWMLWLTACPQTQESDMCVGKPPWKLTLSPSSPTPICSNHTKLVFSHHESREGSFICQIWIPGQRNTWAKESCWFTQPTLRRLGQYSTWSII